MAAFTFEGLARSSKGELEAALRGGVAPDPSGLAGSEWRGWNTPWRMKLLGIQKFEKGFFRGDRGLEGYNVQVRQDGLDAPWVPKPSPERPKRWAFFVIEPADASRRYPNAALIDYGASSRNQRWSVTRLPRDFLVQPDASNPDLLLGKAYLAIGGLRIPSNFFVLERILGSAAWGPEISPLDSGHIG
jgi:hypothetical protein